MMRKTENQIENIILHDIIDISESITPKKNTFRKPKVLKSLSKSPVEFNLTLPDNTDCTYKGICFITDFEGSLKFINHSFLSDRGVEESWFLNRNVMDCIHPEDLPSAIENLIKLIQEDDSFISFQCRTTFGQRGYSNMTWNITCSGQLLFFDVFETDFSFIPTNKEESKTDTLEDYYFDAIYWKLQVSKTINSWDKNVLSYLDFCTEIKRK